MSNETNNSEFFLLQDVEAMTDVVTISRRARFRQTIRKTITIAPKLIKKISSDKLFKQSDPCRASENNSYEHLKIKARLT